MNDVPEIDFTIKGEGEIAFPMLIEALSGTDRQYDQVAGLAFRTANEVVINPPSFITDLDALEYPWRVLNPVDYIHGRGHGFMAKKLPTAPIMTSRGCPNRCTFCAGPSLLGHKLRLRDPKKVVDEIQYLMSEFGIKEVQIIDDNFSFHREHVVQACEEILSRGLDIPWSLPNGVRADRIDYPLLKLMKESGCYYLAFGIEFGSERMLKMTRKSLSLEKAKQSVREAQQLGYITQGFFLMGHPQETKEDALATTNLAREMALDRLSINLAVPLPGSELFDYYVERGYLNIDTVDWEQFAGPQFIPNTEFLPYKDVIHLLRSGYARFYMSPHRVIRYLLKTRSILQLRGLWAGVRTLITSVIRRGKW